ncbi:insulin-like peptide 7 isoform X2 [Panulirus ornatus]|uniref:insulin-like peptide 7 isoform X2 n=1 Tax=Panulirus ornatus TaxID=150431 RepID=UPI003A86479B
MTVQVVLVLATALILVTSSWALDPDLMREIESRTEKEWRELWTEERLMLCRSRLRHNLDAICGKDVYRRSPLLPSRSRRWSHTKHNTDIFLEFHDTETARRNNKKEKRMRTMSVDLPTTRIEINPSISDTGQHNTHTRSPFLSVHQANLFVTTWVGGHQRQRRQSSSITNECCTTVGCTWEEYAEYCPTSSRLRPGVTLI